MKNNEKDIFEPINKHSASKDNFFLFNGEDLSITSPLRSESTRRLNDYDSNLLKEGAYKDVQDDLFRMEYKISRTENEIKNFEKQIQAAKDIKDYNLINELDSRKKILEVELQTLILNYNSKSVSAKVTDKIFNLFKYKQTSKLTFFHNTLIKLSNLIHSKMPRCLVSPFELKRSLEKLENINNSVDELISMNIPYGENYNKYEQLSKYIIKANSIQADINRHIKK